MLMNVDRQPKSLGDPNSANFLAECFLCWQPASCSTRSGPVLCSNCCMLEAQRNIIRVGVLFPICQCFFAYYQLEVPLFTGPFGDAMAIQRHMWTRLMFLKEIFQYKCFSSIICSLKRALPSPSFSSCLKLCASQNTLQVILQWCKWHGTPSSAELAGS